MYNVSYTNGPDDSGSCVSFETLAEAQAARRELVRDGCHPSEVWPVEAPSPAQEIKDMFAPVHRAIDELIASRRVAELGTPGVAVDVIADRPVLVDDLGRPWTVREILEREG